MITRAKGYSVTTVTAILPFHDSKPIRAPKIILKREFLSISNRKRIAISRFALNLVFGQYLCPKRGCLGEKKGGGKVKNLTLDFGLNLGGRCSLGSDEQVARFAVKDIAQLTHSLNGDLDDVVAINLGSVRGSQAG
jgi:hypothetical protein